MIFEVYLQDAKQLSPSLQQPYQAWREQRPIEAFSATRKYLKSELAKTNSTPHDWLFARDLACACGLYEVASVINRLGVARHPNDPWLNILSIWEKSSAAKLMESRNLIELWKTQSERAFHPILDALHVYNYSVNSWRGSALEAQAVANDNANCAVSNYILARAAGARSAWQDAALYCSKAVEQSPYWLRARSIFADSLFARGDVTQGKRCLDEAPTDAPRFLSFELSSAFAVEASGDKPRALEALMALLKNWPIRSRYQRFVARHTALMLTSSGRSTEADQLLQDHRIRNFSVGQAGAQAKRTYISLPLVSQNTKHCVPTVAAMVSESQGVPATPHELAQQMSTRDGTEMWRMIEQMQLNGFRVEVLKAEPEVIEHMLEQNVPLIASLQSVMSSHVEVINGFDNHLKLFYIRDPMHWFGHCIYYDSIARRYEESGGLIALIGPDRADSVKVEDEWRDLPSKAMLELSRACAKADRESAEKAFYAIPDDHPMASYRDGRGRGVVITPREYALRMKQHLNLDKDDLKVRDLRLILSQINFENAKHIREKIESRREKYGDNFTDFLSAQCLISEHRWSEAEQAFQQLCDKYPQSEELWSSYAEVLEQMGKSDDAKQALQTAIDINPEDPSLRERLILLQESSLTYPQQRKEIFNAAKGRMGQADYYPSLVSILADGENGLEYEECLRQCIRYFPRNPAFYSRLADWFLLQGHTKMAKEVVAEARQWMTHEDLPWYFWEEEYKPDSEEDAAQRSEEGASEQENKAIDVDRGIDQLISKRESLVALQLFDSEDVKQLLQLEANDQMRWWQSVRLRSVLIRIILESASKVTSKLAEHVELLKKALPEKIRWGIPERYAMFLFEMISFRPHHRDLAAVFLAWIKEACPRYQRFPTLYFEVAYLEELMGLYTQAYATLDELLKEHPAHASAWYRKAQIEISRTDYKTAWDCLTKAVEISPGLLGAWQELADLAAYVKDQSEIGFRKAICEVHPYSRARFYEAYYVMAQYSPTDASQFLKKQSDRHTKDELLGVQARAQLGLENIEWASSIIDSIDPNELSPSELGWLKVDAAVAKSEFDKALEHLDRLCENDPKDEDAIDKKVRILRFTNPEKAREYATQLIRNGSQLPIAALACVENASNPLPQIQELVSESTPENRDALINTFSVALSRPQDLDKYTQLLGWCNEAHPHLFDLRENYAIRLLMRNEATKANEVAEALLQAEPNNPRWNRLKAIVIQDKDPKKSVELLEQDFELTGSTDSLSKIARGYQLMGNHEQAKKTYWKVLSINPRETISICNLYYKYKQCTPELFAMACDVLDHGLGDDDQYFHVAAVFMALKLKKQIPASWYRTALRRLDIVRSEGGFADEEVRLRAALLAWSHVIKAPPEDMKKLGNIVDKFKALWIWPGKSWIP